LLEPLLRVVLVLGICFYGSLVGFSPPVQRACLLFALWKGLPLIAAQGTTKDRLLLVFMAQTLLFPVGALSESSLLSWAAFMLIVASTTSHGIRDQLITQLLLSCLTGATIGRFSWLGLLVNPLVVPFFGVILYPALMGYLFADLLPQAFLNCFFWPTEAFLAGLHLGARVVAHAPWLALDIHSPLLRILMLAICLGGLFWKCGQQDENMAQ
jgi:predicted membrane metal-binding protein